MTTSEKKKRGVPAKSSRKGSVAAPRGRRAKGALTRRKILDAAFNVIATDGIRGVTHRSVANEADVPLSLITYYFKDIQAMLLEAFEQFSERGRPELQAMYVEVFDYLGGYSRAELRKRAVRESLCETLSLQLCEYVLHQVTGKSVGLVVEQIFFTQTTLAPQLRAMAHVHRRQMLDPLVDVCRYFNRVDPEVDAELLFDSVTALEYRLIASPLEELDKDKVLRMLRRNVGWVMGLKNA
tara:strand:- start:280822 stop:281538 length:717 start_codon:yes stop_codon:yes gene_type:complete